MNMKAIIKGQRYDTAKATSIGSYSSSGGWDDPTHIEETLYRKRNGEYFLHGIGGVSSKYAVANLTEVNLPLWLMGAKIIPLSLTAAMEWAKHNLSHETYDTIFGSIRDGSTTVALNMNISSHASDKLRMMASSAGISLRAQVERLINAAE